MYVRICTNLLISKIKYAKKNNFEVLSVRTKINDQENKIVETHLQLQVYHPKKFGYASVNCF